MTASYGLKPGCDPLSEGKRSHQPAMQLLERLANCKTIGTADAPYSILDLLLDEELVESFSAGYRY